MSQETNETQEMNQGQAVNVLIQAARIAQQKGAFTLEDAEMVSKAIKVFIPPVNENENESADAAMNEEVTEVAKDTESTEPVVMKVK